MNKRFWTISAVSFYCFGIALGLATADTSPATTTTKVVETFDQALWVNSPWNTGVGRTLHSTDIAPRLDSKTGMEFQARFSGNGFEAVTIMPPAPLVIPGELKRLTIQIRRTDKRYPLKMSFLDGWGREKGGDQRPLEWEIPLVDTNAWQTCAFKVPANWVQPITVSGIFTHNWETQAVSNTVTFRLGRLEVVTDLHQVDPATGILKTWKPEPSPASPAKAVKEAPKTPLVEVNFSTGVEDNVFAGEEPRATLRIRNWKPGALTGKASCQVVDNAGGVVAAQNLNIAVDSLASYPLPLTVEKFGRYTLKASLALNDGSQSQQNITFAVLPPLRELTEAQKMASPYGLNVHSGEKIVIDPFKKAGIVWFREYAFHWDWVLRAKGLDRRYAGWPYYNKIVQSYIDAGVKILPVLQNSLSPPEVKNGKLRRMGPDEGWTREMASLMLAFPEVTHWELANEYDLTAAHRKLEEQCDWANYRAYHRQFSEILSIIGGPDKVAVENGRAGIWPKREKNCVASGDFAKIGVLNSHYYCGTEAPELSYENFNMGFDRSEQQLGCLYDLLRAVKQAAQADGKKRESWLTEFGWDTLAGPMVTPYEQAVFLPRMWMMAMAAGADKAFWFYNFDSREAKAFFDGCGLLAANGEPKLSLCSLAGMTAILRAPHYIGNINAGDNTWGYVFQSEGKRIASLWTIKGGQGPVVRFQAEQLYDYLGNKIPGDSAQLSMAPVYAVGLDESDVWWKQTAYSLKTPLLMAAAAGDTVHPVVTINNNRRQPIDCQISLVLPEGWTAAKPGLSTIVKPGERADVELPFVVGLLEAQGLAEARIVIREGQVQKEIPFRLMVQPALSMQAGPIVGRPGLAASVVKLVNLSARAQNATLRFKTPKSWNVATPIVAVHDLKPEEQREIKVDLTWSPNWQPQESASVELDAGQDKPLVQPLIPNEYRLCAAGKIKLDGDISDWPARTELPNWILGSTRGASQSRVFLAWAPEGLYGAVAVRDSRAVARDPGSFWTCDAFELCIDTHDNKQPRAYEAGDHQFWFIPLVGQNRVYAGQWKRAAEVSESRFDIQGIRSAARKTGDGYVMEFLLPAALIKHYRPEIGARIGVNLNLTVHGRQFDREVYWPNPKSSEAAAHPDIWGTLELVN